MLKTMAAKEEPITNAHPLADHPIGVWIDGHEAFVIRLTELGHEVKHIALNQSKHKAILHAKHNGVRASMHVATAEGHERNRLENERSHYLRAVLDAMERAERVVLFGPAEVKHELEQAMRNGADWRKTRVQVINTDRMTPNQRLAWVKRYFR